MSAIFREGYGRLFQRLNRGLFGTGELDETECVASMTQVSKSAQV